jgi:hypothetical protein
VKCDNHEKSSDQISQAPNRGDKFISSAVKVSSKRARSVTVAGDDETESGDAAPRILQKRRKTRGASKLPTPTRSAPPEQAGKARADLSPATEAEIQQMRQDITKAIETLQSISNCVNGLLEFKAILDYKQLQIDDASGAIERQGSQDLIDGQFDLWPWS